MLPSAFQRNISFAFWTVSLALLLQGFDSNALGLFCEHSVSRTLAPVQLSKLAGINLADDITGFRHSFIFISVLFLYGDCPNDKRGSMGNVRCHIFIRSVMFSSRDLIRLFYLRLGNQIMWIMTFEKLVKILGIWLLNPPRRDCESALTDAEFADIWIFFADVA